MTTVPLRNRVSLGAERAHRTRAGVNFTQLDKARQPEGEFVVPDYASYRASHRCASLLAQLGQNVDDDDMERDLGLPADHPKAAQVISQPAHKPSFEPHRGRVYQSCYVYPGTCGHDIGGRRCFRYRQSLLRSIKLLFSSAQRPPHASPPAPARGYASVTRVV